MAARAKQPRRGGNRVRVRRGASARPRLLFAGALVAAAVILFAWFPAGSLISQRNALNDTASQLSTLHRQDAALTHEKKNLSAAGEIGRVAREQYQLVSPGQQAYEVLPPSGTAAAGAPYAGDPGASGPVTPSATSELPDGTTATTAPASTTSPGGAQPVHAPASGGLWSRMVQTLEFWR